MSDPDVIVSDEQFVIHAPSNAVERMLTDSLARSQWRTAMHRGFEASDPVMRPGTTLNFVVGRFGVNFEYVQIVSQYLPGSSLASRTTKGMFFVDTTYEWTEVHGGTRLRCHNRLRVPRNKRFMRWFVERGLQRQLRRDHRTLKHLMETGTQRYLAPSDLTGDEPRRESMQAAGD